MTKNFSAALCALAIFTCACGDDDDLSGDDPVTDSGVIDSSTADAEMGDADVADAEPEADAGPDMQTPPDDPTPQEILAASVVFASCIPDDGIARAMQDIYFRGLESDGGLELTSEMVRCLASTGGGCDATETCLGIAVTATGPCAPSCDGEVFSACDGVTRFAVDCGRFGLACDPRESCVSDEPVGAACDYETYEPVCEGGRPSYCSDTVELGPVCSTLGLDCTVDDTGFGPSARCTGDEGGCTADVSTPNGFELGAGTCVDADQLQVCANGGLHTVSCADFHSSLSCQTTADGSFCARGNECDNYCPPGSDCDGDFGREITCDGDQVVVCDMGVITRVDCVGLGFSGCNAAVNPFGCLE